MGKLKKMAGIDFPAVMNQSKQNLHLYIIPLISNTSSSPHQLFAYLEEMPKQTQKSYSQ